MVIRWGIIGLGDIAENNFVPALAKARNAQLVSVFSRSADKGRAFCAKHRVPRSYDDLDTMLADRELDAVYIASPNGVHAGQSIAASRAGKHVLVDKPMALTEDEGERMIRAAQENNVRLDCAYRQRYHAAHIEARRQVRTGVLGEIELAKAQNFLGNTRPYWPRLLGWRNDRALAGSGSIVAQAVHAVDLLRYLMDSEITEVHCFTDETPARPAEEISMSLFKFANGALGHVESGAVVPRSDNDTVLYGSAGKLTCVNTLGRSDVPRAPEVVVESGAMGATAVRLPFPDDTWVTRTVPLIEDFQRFIVDGTPTLLGAENGLRMIRVASAMIASSRNGRSVRI